jgi:predicted Zn-dependent protease
VRVQERLAMPIPASLPAGTYQPQAVLLSPQGNAIPLRLSTTPMEIQAATSPRAATTGLATNRVAVLVELGQQLRRGELDPLFGRVGQLNQTDPDQVYLRDGEAILRSRLSRDPGNLNDLYALALAQALQRHAGDAAITLQQITQLDPGNANANLSLGLVQLYRFKPWAAEPPLSIAAELDPKNKTTKILRAVQQAMTGNWHSAVQLLR